MFYIDFLLHVSCNYLYGNRKVIHWYKEFSFRQKIVKLKGISNCYYICG